MPGVTSMLIGGAASNILGGIVGGIASAPDRAAAGAAMQRALQAIEEMGAPPDLAREIILKEFDSAGVLTPEIEKQIDLGTSKIAQIQESPELKKAQLGALAKFQEASETGFTPEARAAFAEAQTQASRNAQARMQQILQQQQMRGLGGAGSTLAAQLQSGAAAAADESDAALRASAMASQSALQAAAQSGQLGSQMRGQEFDIARTKAGAEDQFALQRFNEAVSRQQRNVGAQNLAQQYNLTQKQQLANMNVSQRNAEMQRQRAAEAQRWQMQMQKAQALAGVYQGQAQQQQQQAAATQQGWTQAVGGLGSGLFAGANYMSNRDFQNDYLNYLKGKKTANPAPIMFDDGEDS